MVLARMRLARKGADYISRGQPAGALGKPCWLPLRDYKTDWRWLAEGDDSPWYPGVMRLFRQSRAGQQGPVWGPPIDDVAAALATFAKVARRQ